MTETTLSQHEQTTSAPDRSGHAMDQPQALIPTRGWMWIVVLGGLFVLLHMTYLERLFRIVTNASGDSPWLLVRWGELFKSAMLSNSWNANWSHALVIPLISLYFLFQSRDRLSVTPTRTCWWGLAVMCFGLLSYTWWIYPGRNDMFQGYSALIGLFGLLLFLLGPTMMRLIWFPVLYLGFAVKIADALWERIAWKMQDIAATTSYVVLQFLSLIFQYDISLAGNQLSISFMKNGQMVSESMNVAEACSGLRMLMAFIALGTALAFITPRPWWQRLLMVLMAVPVAIAVNVGRVVTIGLLQLVNPELARGEFHTFVGMLMLIPAALLILLIGWCANRIFIPAPENQVMNAPMRQCVNIQPIKQSSNEAIKTPALLATVGKGAVLGVLVTVVLGLGYVSIWQIGSLPLFELLPQAVLIPTMVLLIGVLAIVVTLAARATGRYLRQSDAQRLPLCAGLAAGLLAAAWIGQNSAIARTQVVLIKKAVPSRHPLSLIPHQIGSWEMFFDERDHMTAEVIEVLGTTNFVSRYYHDNDSPDAAKFDPRGRYFEPGAVARLHVAYYTGNPDTVPHVPTRCFLAGGATGVSEDQITLQLDQSRYHPDPLDQQRGYLCPVPSNPFMDVRVPALAIPATRFTYLPFQSTQQQTAIYFFVANGKFIATPNQVRFTGFDPRDEYAYYCKIEISLLNITDPQEATEKTEALLQQFLPEIMAVLPDWIDVREGRWPLDPATTPDAAPRSPTSH
ncbi:MAG: exosortase/archaeosortase family protein [Phycisphaeraceae bacterium]|nr:exosortase/archaeosortase family protein [Phycisphaeraceae bacterium]